MIDGEGVVVSAVGVECAPGSIGLFVSFTLAPVAAEAWVDTGETSLSLKLEAAGAGVGEEVLSRDAETGVAAAGVAVTSSTGVGCTESCFALVTTGNEIGGGTAARKEEPL